MICIARIFGAPESVPAGKAARTTSSGGVLSGTLPRTSLTMCITCEKRSTSMRLHELDRADLGDASDVVAPEIDEHDVLGALLRIGEQLLLERERPPRGSCRARRVPASGRTVIVPPSRRTIVSGLAPAMRVRCVSPGAGGRSRKYMYGDGLSSRIAR